MKTASLYPSANLKKICAATSYMSLHFSTLCFIFALYRIAENFQGRKLSQIGEKCDFRRENFRGLLAFAAPKDATPPNFMEKTFADSHKSAKFAKVTLGLTCACNRANRVSGVQHKYSIQLAHARPTMHCIHLVLYHNI